MIESAVETDTLRTFSLRLHSILTAKEFKGNPDSLRDVVTKLRDKGFIDNPGHTHTDRDYSFTAGIVGLETRNGAQIDIYSDQKPDRKGKIADIAINGERLLPLLLSGKFKKGVAEWELGRILGLQFAGQETGTGTATTKPSNWRRVLRKLGI